MNALWIDTAEGLGAAIERLAPGPIGFDLEADSFHHFHEKVCLIQISDGGADLLIDPLAGFDLAPLAPVLAASERRKVLHGADYDVRMLRGGLRLELRGLFDTMVAARLAGELTFGLAALLERHLGIKVDKAFQRADWSLRPLPAPLREYAALDTHHLLELAERLDRRLAELGRTAWAAEEFRRLEGLQPATPEPEPWRRVKGAVGLERRELAILRELSRIRDEQARAQDRPRFRVLRDEVLLEASRVLARAGAEPAAIRGLPESWQREPTRSRMLEAVQRALALPAAELPARLDRGRPSRDPLREKRVRELATRRDGLARNLGLEPSVVASRPQLEDALESLAAGNGLAGARTLREWQKSLLAPVFADLG